VDIAEAVVSVLWPAIEQKPTRRRTTGKPQRTR
jgi:hypothetical protein